MHLLPFIFGTHDSATYFLNSSSKIYNINPIISDLLQLFGHDHQLVYDWSKTQVYNISQQVELGIKYLDLRAIKVDDIWYSCHGLLGDRFDHILQHIPNDVIIELTTYSTPDINLCNKLKGKLVYMSHDTNHCQGTMDIKLVNNTFANTPHLETMVEYNKRVILEHNSNSNKILKLSWTLTPNVFTMIESLYKKPKTLLELAQEANDAWSEFVEWMVQGNYKWPNIVIFDFILQNQSVYTSEDFSIL